MSQESDGSRGLAGAVVEQAFADLIFTSLSATEQEEVRASAKKFLLEELWEPDCIWGALLDLKKFEIIAGVQKTLAEADGVFAKRAAAKVARMAKREARSSWLTGIIPQEVVR